MAVSLILLLGALLVACGTPHTADRAGVERASGPPTPPPTLRLAAMEVVLDRAPARLALVETSTRPESRGTAMIVGGGVGLFASAMACAGAGPFAPLCMATIVPVSMALGAGSGAVVGTVYGEAQDSLAAKRLLLSQIAPGLARLDTLPRWQAAAGVGVAESDARTWRLELNWSRLEAVGRGQPHALSLALHAQLRPAGSSEIAFAKEFQLTGDERWTSEQWAADGGRLAGVHMQRLADGLLRQLAAELQAPR